MSSTGDELDRSKYPVNAKGFTVIPCVPLQENTIRPWMVGLKVTMGLGEVGIPTQTATIEGYDSNKLSLKMSNGKVKKFEFNPSNIELQCYQFHERILFSNEVIEPN